MRHLPGNRLAAVRCRFHWLWLSACLHLDLAAPTQRGSCLAKPGEASDCSAADKVRTVADHVLLQRDIKHFKADGLSKVNADDVSDADEDSMPGPRVRVHIHTHIFGHRAHIRPDTSTRGKTIPCRKPVYATDYDADQACPEECPFWAEDTVGKTKPCRFQCVRAADCGSLDVNATIADKDRRTCRQCLVPACENCLHRKDMAVEEEKSESGWLDWLLAEVRSSVVLPEEQCVKCTSGYDLVDGRCRSQRDWMWQLFFVVLAFIVFFFCAWYFQLFFRPVVNQEGLEHGLKFRSRTRVHMYALDEAARQLWPLNTNLCKEDTVAGPGLALFFNYHRHIILWGFLVGAGWLATALIVSSDLLVVGLRGAGTPQQLCSVIKYGHKFQTETMWLKVVFIFFVYLGTFLASMIHAGLQMCRFQTWDDETTMRDFAAFCSGLPDSWSDRCDSPEGPKVPDDAEAQLANLIQDASGERVVGVSICWSFKAQSKKVRAISNRDVNRAEKDLVNPFSIRTQSTLTNTTSVPSPEDDRITKFFKNVDKMIGMGSPHDDNQELKELQGFHVARQNAGSLGALGAAEQRLPSPRTGSTTRERSPRPFPKRWGGASQAQAATAAPQDDPGAPPEKVVSARPQDEKGLLQTIGTAGYAVAVFETEASRDMAVESIAQSDGLEFKDNRLRLQAIDWEPDTMLWKNFAWPRSRISVVARLLLGILCIIGCLALWATCFYLPYAYYTLSFSYARGEMPGLAASSVFTLLVVAGNQIMYVVCSEVTHRIRFFCQDTFEFTYMVLYTFACMINLFFDLVVTYYTTYVTMLGLNVYTYDGKHLNELTLFDLFMSYPMQRALGHQLFWYAFPSCFLAPYILEPLFATHLPFHIAKLIVRSDPSFRGYHAEDALRFWCPMDFSRYADILLNVCIAVTSFLFPGGFVLQTFGTLCLSHIYMYWYDHYRVLREIPGLILGSSIVDTTVNIMMAVPCCILLTCLIFKIHCLPEYQDVSRGKIATEMVIACSAHVILHVSILLFVLPLCRRRHHRSQSSFAEAAGRLPCSWFNANPVHCLRSKYIYQHKPAFMRFVRGKEYLQVVNRTIGQHYAGGSPPEQ